MKKVLFLVGSYLPRPSANGICAMNIIDELESRNDEVTCIAYSEIGSPEFEIVNNTKVYRIKRNLVDNGIALCEKKSRYKFFRILKKMLILINKIKQIVLLPLYPWTDLFFSLRMYKMAVKLHEVEKFDVVVSVHKPIDTLIVGSLLKHKYDSIKLITYFLDSLSGGFNLKVLPSSWSIKRRLNWERKLLKKSDKNVMMASSSEHHHKYSRNTSHYKQTVFLDIPLLTEKNLMFNEYTGILPKKKINILYTGTLYQSTRNPEYILELFTLLNRPDISITFIGKSDCQNIFQKYRKSFKGELQHLDNMEHEKILGVLSEADFLLNIGVKNQNAISGKIFEYMTFGKPIISTFEFDNEPCIPYLSKYKPSLLLDQRIDLGENKEILADFIEGARGTKLTYNCIQNTFYKNTPKAFLETLDSVVRGDSN